MRKWRVKKDARGPGTEVWGVVVRRGGPDPERKGETRGAPLPALKGKHWAGRRCSEAQRELSSLGLAGLGHLKITPSWKSEIEGSRVCRVRPARGMLRSGSHRREQANRSHLIPSSASGSHWFPGCLHLTFS